MCLPRLARAARLLRAAAVKWKDDRADVMAAALAYYSAFSLAPLLMLAVGAASLTASAQESQRLILDLVYAVIGPRAADAVGPLIEGAHMKHGGLATAFGAVTLLYGASTLFVHLQSALNVIWSAPAPGRGWVVLYVKRRLFSTLLVAVVPLLLLFGPAWSAWLGAIGRSQLRQILASLIFETALFGFIFKVLPDVPVPWKDVWAGALFTAALFTLCQTGLGVYLNRIGARSAYGAAGSLVALLVWLHVSAQILLFGAEFTRILRDEGVLKFLRFARES